MASPAWFWAAPGHLLVSTANGRLTADAVPQAPHRQRQGLWLHTLWTGARGGWPSRGGKVRGQAALTTLAQTAGHLCPSLS